MNKLPRIYKYGNEALTCFNVPLEKRDWSIEWKDYRPTPIYVDFTDKPWADPDINDPSFKPQWNALDGNIDRRSHCGSYLVNKQGYPQNPTGRTGARLRGLLGRWGPNHAADPIVTRWKRDNKCQIITHQSSNKPILQFVAIQRRDVKEWAIPGGMVDAGENVSATLKREFCEESLNSLEMSAEKKKGLNEKLKKFFSHGETVYQGYVDDPRNTDNAWIETVAVNFHDKDGDVMQSIDLEAGDDAQGVRWVDIDQSIQLYANHRELIQITAHNRNAHW